MANPHPEPHPENLKHFKKGEARTVDSARKGQRKSTEAQAKKRTMKQWAKFYGELQLHPGRAKDPRSAEEIRDSNTTMDGAVIAAMYAKATKGDTRAASFLASIKGEMTEDITVHADPLATLTEAQLDAILDAISKARKADE